jgi:hypothetical protein
MQLFGKNFPLQNVAKKSRENYKITVYDPEYNKIEEIKGTAVGGSFKTQ